MSTAPGTVELERSLPSTWYRTDAVFAVEKERIFCREWIAVGRAEELPAPGDHRILDALGESVILLRNRDGELRAFYNVCRHRGSRLCRSHDEPVNADRPALAGGLTAGRLIVCPYHQWSYDLNGQLVAAPHLNQDASFDKSNYSLYPVGVDTWGGFVFVNLTPREAKPLAAQLGETPALLQRYPLSDLRIGATLEYRVAANWKILSENYNECYHCGGVHPELCAVVPAFKAGGGANLDWQRGVAHRDGAWTFTKSGTTKRRAFPGLNADEQVRHKGALLYPNLWVSLASDHAAVFILRPRGPALTDVTCQFLFEPHELAKSDFDGSDSVDFWDMVNRQDWSACESVQEGIGSRVHHHGYYAPMEDFNLDIRRYVSDRVGQYLDGAVG